MCRYTATYRCSEKEEIEEEEGLVEKEEGERKKDEEEMVGQ